MHDVKPAVLDALQSIKDLLLDVGVLLERADSGSLPEFVPEMDLRLREAWSRAEMSRRLCLLFRVPQVKSYDPAELLRRHSGEERVAFRVPEAVPASVGDPDQVLECFRLFRSSIALGRQGSLRAEIVTEGDSPRVVLTLEGAGRIPETFSLDQVYQFDLEAFANRWICATDGGYLAIAEKAAILYLRGDRNVPPSIDGLEAPLAALARLSRLLTSWRGATGHFEPGLVSAVEVQRLYSETVAKGMAIAGDIARELGS